MTEASSPRGATDDAEAPELLRVFAAARPHPLQHAVPDELRPWLLSITWDQRALWSIAGPVTRISVADLVWHYELPWWKSDHEATSDVGGWFSVRPGEVIANPDAHPWHSNRIRTVELAHPVHVLRRRGRWLILDGIHRLVRADAAGSSEMRAIVLSTNDIARIAGAVPSS